MIPNIKFQIPSSFDIKKQQLDSNKQEMMKFSFIKIWKLPGEEFEEEKCL